MKFTQSQWVLALLSGVGAGLFPVLASALGLGDIEVDSRLNQPLRARIEVVGVTDEEWRQVRASIRTAGLSGEDAAHPELLESLTLVPVEDANHKHFIQVKSGAVLTEPLFDLPLEVSGQAAHVVRNYSVLLDPEAMTGAQPALLAGGGAAAAGVGSAGDVVQAAKAEGGAQLGHAAATRKVAGAARKSSRHARIARRASTRARAPGPVAAAAHETVPQSSQPAATPPDGAENDAAGPQGLPTNRLTSDSLSAKQQLEQQLAILQQTLAQMQSTIAAQDAEIAKLTRKMASVGGAPLAPAQAAGARDDEDSTSTEEAVPASFWLRPTVFYRLAAGLCLAALFAALIRKIVRKRKANAAQGATTASFRDMPFDAEAFASRQQVVAQAATRERTGAPSGQRPPDRIHRNSNYHVEETSDIESAESAKNEPEADGMESWRTQTALLEQDILSATDALPYVKDTINQVKPAIEDLEAGLALSEEQELELQEAMQAHELLEGQQTLEIQTTVEMPKVAQAEKTLEIRPTFEMNAPEASATNPDVVKNLESLLSKLKLDPGSLSPTQRSHLEMLRRTLEDGKLEEDAFLARQATG